MKYDVMFYIIFGAF